MASFVFRLNGRVHKGIYSACGIHRGMEQFGKLFLRRQLTCRVLREVLAFVTQGWALGLWGGGKVQGLTFLRRGGLGAGGLEVGASVVPSS